MGSWPLAQPLFYQYKRTERQAERLRGNGSAQKLVMPVGLGELISKATRFSVECPAGRAAARGNLGQHPSPMHGTTARPPQPRESSHGRHPHTGPGAEGGGGWPMHATAQPWHAEGRPLSHREVRSTNPNGALRRLLSPRERRGTPPAARPGGCHGSSPAPPWQPAPFHVAPCAPARRWPAPAPSRRS
jgi:hypothetical protein